MTCDDARAALASGEPAGALDSHLADCADCAARRADYAAIHASLVDAFAGAKPPGSLEGRIVNAFHARRARRSLWFWAAAAVVLAGIFIAYVVKPRVVRDIHRYDSAPAFVTPLPGAQFEGKVLARGDFLATLKSDWEAFTPVGTLKSRRAVVHVSVGRKEDPVTRERVSFVVAFVLSGMVTLTNDHGAASAGAGESLYAQEGQAPKRHVEDLARRFGKFFEPVKIDVAPSVPATPLPVDLSKVGGFDRLAPLFGLAADEPLLRKNAFIVAPLGKFNPDSDDDLADFYKELHERGLPTLITVDTLLHLYHVQFDETLRDIEEREFLRDVTALAKTLVEKFEADESEPAKLAEAAMAIALKALDPDAEIPERVRADVERHLAWIKAHQGFEHSTLFNYKEDFSQYVPRGHYTRSEALKRYFAGMMWLGRMTFILKGGEPHGEGSEPYLVSKEDADLQTRAACLIAQAMKDEKLRATWERIYAVTSFYVGLADDLGLEDYDEALEKIAGAAAKAGELDDPKLLDLRADLALRRPPAIYSGTGGQAFLPEQLGDKEKLVEALQKSMGFRFMGQRFVPDSYMMSRLVSPTVGEASGAEARFTAAGKFRAFPRGLDVMAILGSARARELLRELGDDKYDKYDVVLKDLESQFEGFNEHDWNRNLYWSWLYSLKALFGDFRSGYPAFMTSPAYRTRSLNAALASWSQLRHDTILYVKQSASPRGSAAPRRETPVNYVEPNVEFYARLQALARMTRKGLADMKTLSKEAEARLAALETLLEKLTAISSKELRNEALTGEECEWIASFGGRLAGLASIGRRAEFRTSLVADVHTDANTGRVLEEATGNLEAMIVVFATPDGALHAAAGPVLTYYEFKHPMSDRLTDEAWREMLKKDPAQPEWTKEFRK